MKQLLLHLLSCGLVIGFLGGKSLQAQTAYRINFSNGATPPAGWETDLGEPYGLRPNGLTYGWVDPISFAPVSLTNRARNRAPSPDVDVIRETLNHMRYSDVTDGSQDGDWEIALPTGTYQVSVQLGSANTESTGGTRHAVRAEGQTLIDFPAPNGTLSVRNATGQVTVSDGRLTIDAADGVNTKIHAIIIEDFAGTRTPVIIGTTPLDGQRNVSQNPTISANNIFLPNADINGLTSLDNSTITNTTVRLYQISGPNGENGPLVPATVNGTGGGDAINLTPSSILAANTWHRLIIDGVTDLTGESLMPYSIVFETDSTIDTGGGSGDLSQVSFENAGTVKTGQKYTTLDIGPDGKLYGLTIGGDIYRWDINGDGTLANEAVLSGWKTNYGGSRTAIGLVFDPASTAGNLIAYVSHCSSGLSSAPAWDGKISRLTGADLATEELLVTNLPRSIRDHLTNSMVFRPGEPHVIYFNQGSNSAGGRADGAWGNRPERLLSAACLRLDLSLLPAILPLDVQTSMDINVIDNVSTSSPTFSDGTYNPYYVNAPLTLFATGVRNAYDLVWHSNGQLYIPTNGTAGGSNSPASVDGMRRPDGSAYLYANGYQQVPDVGPSNTQRDWLFRIDPTTGIGYYGHPNPLRGEYIHNRGAVDVSTYAPEVVADPNYRGAAFDFEFNKSPNGVIEYKSDAHEGNLTGALLVCRYSGGSDIIALIPDGLNGNIGTSRIGISGFTGFQDPLDLIEDQSNGNLYVSDFGRSEIILLRPNVAPESQGTLTVRPDSLIFDEDVNATSPTVKVIVENTGTAPINTINLTLSGLDASSFNVSPTILNDLAPNTSVSVDISFSPTVAGPHVASLIVSSPDAGVELDSVRLKGLGKSGEPSLQWVLDTYFGPGAIDVGDDDPTTNVIHSDPNQYTSTKLGDDVGWGVFKHADVTNPVTVEILSVFGPTANDPIVALAWYEMDNPTTFQEFFTLTNSPASNGQTLTFSVPKTYSFNPSKLEFGFYSRWPFFGDRKVYSEDALNTFPESIPHHVRVYPLPGEENAFVVATEEHISGFDFQDIVFVVRNVELGGTEVVVENSTKLPGTTEGFPAEDWFVFQRINNQMGGGSTYSIDDTATMIIRNMGSRPLVITEFNISDRTQFVLPNGEDTELPLCIPVGGAYNLLMQFVESAGSKGTRLQTMELVTNGGKQTVTLAGGYQLAPEGGNEILLPDILEVFGFTSKVPRGLPWNGEYPTAAQLADPNAPYGADIVVSEYWRQADPSQPVIGMFMYAQFGIGNFPIDVSYWDVNDDIVGGFNFRAATSLPNGEVQAQRLFPKTRLPGNNYDENAGINIPLITDDFRVRIGPRNTSGNGNITSEGLPRYLGARMFRVRDQEGEIVPNTYVLTFDLTPGNHDFNDGVAYLRNIEPVPESSFPIELTTFTAIPQTNRVDISWQTAMEEHTEQFVVLRSSDGRVFESIGGLPAAGYSQEPLTYQLSDLQPLTGKSFYQLKSMDLDGSVSMSQVVEVYRDQGQLAAHLFPNPAKQSLTVALNPVGRDESPVTLHVYNAMGQQVHSIQRIIPPNGLLDLDTSSFGEGVYFLHVLQANGYPTKLSFRVSR